MIQQGQVFKLKAKGVHGQVGQRLYTAIEFEDGTWYREKSKDMEKTTRTGKLTERQLGFL